MQPAGLRELKKNQTRQLIADTARELFTARGFEAVTVDDVAQAAQVSKKTVFNYFATKEDLVLHRAEERQLLVLATIRERTPDESLVDAFERTALDRLTELAEHLDPNRLGGFLRLVESSPALQRRMRELQGQLVVAATEALRAETGAAADDPAPGRGGRDDSRGPAGAGAEPARRCAHGGGAAGGRAPSPTPHRRRVQAAAKWLGRLSGRSPDTVGPCPRR